MNRLTNANKDILTALALGTAAWMSNIACSSVISGNYPPLGNFFLLISASALGPLGGLVSVAVGAVPATLISGEHLEGLRIIILCLAIGYATRYKPEIPTFIVAVILWTFVFAPILLLLGSSHFISYVWSPQETILTCLTEISLTVVAGTTLLSQNVWVLLTRIPRRNTLMSISVHILATISLISIFGVLGLMRIATGHYIDPSWTSIPQGALWLITIFSALLSLSLVFAKQFARLLTDNFQEIFNADLSFPSRNTGFSGLSKEHWRRKVSAREQRLKEWEEGDHRDKSEILSTAIEQYGQGLCAVTRDGTISFVNRLFLKMVGAQDGEFEGKRLDQLGIPMPLCVQFMDLVENCFLHGEQVTEIKTDEGRNNLKFYEVSVRTSQTSVSSLPEGENHPATAIINLKDITERRTIENHLLRAEKLGSLGRLVRGIAHEFNNALTTITGEASVLKRLSGEESGAHEKERTLSALNNILNTAAGAADITRKLLDYMDESSNLTTVEDLSCVISGHLSLLTKLVGEECEISFSKRDCPIWVNCDSNLILQALTNLMINAKDAYEAGGEIRISLATEELDESASRLHIGARPGLFARLRVEDFGIGMNRDVLSKAFDPLFTTKSSRGNAGLGLSIVYSIVRAHDGFLTGESHPGKGTSISFYLPIVDPPPEETAKETEQPQNERYASIEELFGNNEKILVVEDEPTVRELVASMLSGLGYDVTSCEDGHKALNISEATRFDLLLVDMIMPKMRGIDLISRIRQRQAEVKALIMTGYGPGLEQDLSEICIQKPFDVDTLAKAVKVALRT